MNANISSRQNRSSLPSPTEQYADAYALLSSHAKARMSLNQFTPAAGTGRFPAKRIESV